MTIDRQSVSSISPSSARYNLSISEELLLKQLVVGCITLRDRISSAILES